MDDPGAAGGLLERVPDLRVQRGEGVVDGLLRDPGALQVDAVEAVGVLADRRAAADADVLGHRPDQAHRAVDVEGRARQHAVEGGPGEARRATAAQVNIGGNGTGPAVRSHLPSLRTAPRRRYCPHAGHRGARRSADAWWRWGSGWSSRGIGAALASGARPTRLAVGRRRRRSAPSLSGVGVGVGSCRGWSRARSGSAVGDGARRGGGRRGRRGGGAAADRATGRVPALAWRRPGPTGLTACWPGPGDGAVSRPIPATAPNTAAARQTLPPAAIARRRQRSRRPRVMIAVGGRSSRLAGSRAPGARGGRAAAAWVSRSVMTAPLRSPRRWPRWGHAASLPLGVVRLGRHPELRQRA